MKASAHKVIEAFSVQGMGVVFLIVLGVRAAPNDVTGSGLRPRPGIRISARRLALLVALGWFVLALPVLAADDNPLEAEIRTRAAAVEKKVIAWREDLHQHPELGQQELRTSGLVVRHLLSLGLEVRTNIALTGVVGLLRGTRPGPR